MGARANLVLVDQVGYQLYYSHWCAETIPSDIFWGTEWTLDFIQRQEPVPQDERGWLDTVWAEGGVLMDTHYKKVLFWGGEDFRFNIPLRHLYMELVQEVWQGWTVTWAKNEIFDLADYVGVERSIVTGQIIFGAKEMSGGIATTGPLLSAIASIVWEDQTLRFYATWGDAHVAFLTKGVQILARARTASGQEKFDLSQWQNDEFLWFGLHIDMNARLLGIWSYMMPPLAEIQAAWQGWDVLWWGDNYQEQLVRTEGKFQMPFRSTETLLVKLESVLVTPNRRLGVELYQRIRKSIEAEGGVSIGNPHALIDSPQTTSEAVRRAIFQMAVAAWRTKQA